MGNGQSAPHRSRSASQPLGRAIAGPSIFDFLFLDLILMVWSMLSPSSAIVLPLVCRRLYSLSKSIRAIDVIENRQAAMAQLAFDGELPLLKWFCKKLKFPRQDVCAAAARGKTLLYIVFEFSHSILGNSVAVLAWMASKGYLKSRDYDCIIHEGARAGHQRVLAWCQFHTNISAAASAGAAAGGQLELIRLLRIWGCPFDESVTALAAKHGHSHILLWAIQNECPLAPNLGAIAVRAGRLYLALELNRHGVELNAKACEAAAARGSLHDLKALREHGAPWDDMTTMAAVKSGKLEILQYALKKGCPAHPLLCSKAAITGRLHILAWAHESAGLPIGQNTLAHAALGGHIDIMDWLFARGCGLSVGVFRIAATGSYIAALQWLHIRMCPWGPEVCLAAAESGQWETLYWLRENGCPWDPFDCYEASIRCHHFRRRAWKKIKS